MKSMASSNTGTQYEDINEPIAAKGKKNLRERKMDLGCKRARSSFKLNTSQLSISLDPEFEINQLQDPVEFFSAYEKRPNAKKEIEKERGDNVTDLNMYSPSTNTLRRRRRILGESYSYKHTNSPVLSDSDDTRVSFQKISQQDTPAPSNSNLHQVKVAPDIEAQEIECAVSVTETENRVNGILDELVYSSNGNFDGDMALSLLQGHLQIEPIDLDKLCLDINTFCNDFEAVSEKLPKTPNTLSDLDTILKTFSGKKLVKLTHLAKIPSDPLISATSVKSVFSSISLSNKRTLQKNSSNILFPSPRINMAAVGSLSAEVFGTQSDLVEMMEEFSKSSKLKKVVEDKSESTIMISIGSQNVTGGDSVNDNPNKLFGFRLNEALGDLVDHDGGIDTDDWALSGNAEEMLQETVSFAKSDVNSDDSNRFCIDVSVEENVEAMPQETVSSAQTDITVKESRTENLNNSLGRSNYTASEDHALEESPENTETTQQQNEELQSLSLNKRCKSMKPRGGRQRNVSFCNQRHAEAGSLGSSGLRRSSRITRRPLKYWKGERFLYGRVDNSMPTVIGLKYIANGDEKATFAVKSFVSDDYKELVDLAALH